MSIATAEPEAQSHLVRNVQLEDVKVDGKNGDGRTSGPEFDELVDDIRQHGVIQAVLVRAAYVRGAAGSGWHLIAGHRRLAAARKLGHQEIPAVVSTLGPEHDEELRLVENLHRLNVHPLDEAESYRKLLAAPGFSGTIATLAQRIGRPPRYVHDRIRLTNLTPDAQRLFRDGRIEIGHAVILARLAPALQKQALDPSERRGAPLFVPEETFFEEAESKDPWARTKTKTPAELQRWIDEHVRADPDDVDPVLFPVTAEELAAAKKVIPITRSSFLQQETRTKDRTYGPLSWKRADGQEGSKTCELSATGFVVAGRGRNESFPVCVAKEKCSVHWGAEMRQKARRAKTRKPVAGGAATAPAKAEPKFDREMHEAKNKARLEAMNHEMSLALTQAAEMKPAEVLRAFLEHSWGFDVDQYLRFVKGQATQKEAKAWLAAARVEDLQRALVYGLLSEDADARAFKAFGVDVHKIDEEFEKKAVAELEARRGNAKPQASGSAEKKENVAKPPRGQRPRKRGAKKAAAKTAPRKK